MPQSLMKIYIHIIFSTKKHVGLLADEDICSQMHTYLASILREYDCPAIIIGGVADHVHILCHLSKTNTLAKVIGETKRNSSKWIKTKNSNLLSFQWQNGYGAFSVSYSNVESVKDYIANQERHHQKMSFQEEFRIFLKKHKVEFDEQYVWD